MSTLEIGLVTRPHGIAGELKVRLHFEQSEALFEVSRVLIELPSGELAEHQLGAVRRAGKGLLVKLTGVDSRDAAEALRGAKLLVERAQLAALAPDEYYLIDLIGCQVLGPEGPLGSVAEVQSHPTLDSLMIRTPDGKLLEQPLADEWLERVSVDERVIVLSSLDGLIT